MPAQRRLARHRRCMGTAGLVVIISGYPSGKGAYRVAARGGPEHSCRAGLIPDELPEPACMPNQGRQSCSPAP